MYIIINLELTKILGKEVVILCGSFDQAMLQLFTPGPPGTTRTVLTVLLVG